MIPGNAPADASETADGIETPGASKAGAFRELKLPNSPGAGAGTWTGTPGRPAINPSWHAELMSCFEILSTPHAI